MNFKNFIRSKKTGAYIGLGVLLLYIVSLAVYLQYVATDSELLMVPLVIVFLALGIAGEIALFFFDNDYLPVVIATFSMFALGFFALKPLATLWSIVSYFSDGGIVMEGAIPGNFGLIVAIAVLLFVTAAAAVTACFFTRVKKAGIPVVTEK